MHIRRYEGVILLNRGHGELDIQYRDEIGDIHILHIRSWSHMPALLACLVWCFSVIHSLHLFDIHAYICLLGRREALLNALIHALGVPETNMRHLEGGERCKHPKCRRVAQWFVHRVDSFFLQSSCLLHCVHMYCDHSCDRFVQVYWQVSAASGSNFMPQLVV